MSNRPRMTPPRGEPSTIVIGKAIYVSPDGRDMPVDAAAVADLAAAGWTLVSPPSPLTLTIPPIGKAA